MRGRELTVKWLHAEFARVLFETTRIHQRNSSEPTYVGVMQSSSIVEIDPQRRIVELRWTEVAAIDQQGPGKARLNHDPITGVEIDYYELRATPAAQDCCVAESLSHRARTHFTQDVGFANGNVLYLT